MTSLLTSSLPLITSQTSIEVTSEQLAALAHALTLAERMVDLLRECEGVLANYPEMSGLAGRIQTLLREVQA